MAEQLLTMSAEAIAKTVGTVGSPLVVISELIKNAVDASATEVNVFYDAEGKTIRVKNNKKGLTTKDIAKLHVPGTSSKKTGSFIQNDEGMFLTGSKGLGLLSVFLLSQESEIHTVAENNHLYKISLNRTTGGIEVSDTSTLSDEAYTEVILKDVDYEIITLLSSESEIKKLRHICTYLYKPDLPFPKMYLHVTGQEKTLINFSCPFPDMLFDVRFRYEKSSQKIYFKCLSPNKIVNENEIEIEDFSLDALQQKMRTAYRIKETIATRTNETPLAGFADVPSFEGRILVYEKKLAGERLKTYGAGVNVYVNEFALYNYLAEENDWLGLADYSQRKKVTRLKPHNVFGYVNFPNFDENSERLMISNERADFIQDMIFRKLMYLIKGVIMFAVFNIDVADKNPKYKDIDADSPAAQGNNISPSGSDPLTSVTVDQNNGEGVDDITASQDQPNYTHSDSTSGTNSNANENLYEPQSFYSPTPNVRKRLQFTEQEGSIINGLKDTSNLGDKIYGLVYELSKLDTDEHRYAVSCLYRCLIESSTKQLSNKHPQVAHDSSNLQTSVINALNYMSGQIKSNAAISDKKIKECRDTVNKNKLIDIINEYVHNETIPDAFKLQESWNTMKEYIIMCLSV